MTSNKICFVGDIHIGSRNANPIVKDNHIGFFTDTLIPFMVENGHTTLMTFGDLFETRKYTNHVILDEWRTKVFDLLKRHSIEFVSVLGNHDIAYRNTLKVNTPSLCLDLKHYDNIRIIDTPTVYKSPKYNNFEMLMVPWICDDNQAECFSAIEKYRGKYVGGHFEISSFEMHRGHVCTGGIGKEIFKRFERVFSGHFHKHSDDGKIKYIGTPYQSTWIDHGEDKGFWVFDTTTGDIEFKKNDNDLFAVVYYDEQKPYVDPKTLEKKYCKIVAVNKDDQKKYDAFIKAVESVDTADVKIVEEVVTVDDSNVDINLLDAKDIISAYVDGVDTTLDKDKLKEKLHRAYMISMGAIE